MTTAIFHVLAGITILPSFFSVPLLPATPAERIAALFGQRVAAQLESFDEVGAWGRV